MQYRDSRGRLLIRDDSSRINKCPLQSRYYILRLRVSQWVFDAQDTQTIVAIKQRMENNRREGVSVSTGRKSEAIECSSKF